MTVASTASLPGGAFLIREASPDSVFTPEEFGPDARLMAQTAEDFLRKEVLPLTNQIESHDTDLMARLMRKAGDLGLLGAEVPEVYGGLGLDNRTGALLAEKLNWQQSFALTHEAHTVIATLPLLYFGSHEQKAKYLPKLASGEWIGSFALSEAGSGSDALGAQARATLSPDGSNYVLNGTKMWITNTAFANLFTVFAKVDGDRFSAFLVERDTPGLSFGKEEHKLGMKGTSTRRVILEGVKVPVENLICGEGKGVYAAFCALNMGRFKLEAGAVGGIKETIAVCAAYAKQRRQFGRPIADFGLIQAKLGEMAARCFALESAVYRLAGLLDGVFDDIVPDAPDASERYHRAAEEYAIECSIVKVIGSELYSWATDEGIQIHGGYGYTEEFPMARAWRDQRLLRIGEGANEIVRIAIVSTLLRREKSGRIDLTDATRDALGVPCDEASEETLESLVCQLKKAGLLLLDLARKEWGDSLLEQQEVVAAIADIIAAAYTAESAAIRARKLESTGSKSAGLALNAALLYTVEALQSVQAGACAAVEHMQSSDKSHEVSGRVMGELMVWGKHDRIALRRRIAAAVLDREAFPW